MAGRNFDYARPLRGRMAKNALREMAKHAARLDKDLQDDDRLPAWIDYYIATSSDRMHTVGNYMQGVLKEFQPSASSLAQESAYGDTEDYGKLEYNAQVMMRNYGVDNRGYGSAAPEPHYGNWWENAVDNLTDWARSDQDTLDNLRTAGRTLAIIYLASMPIAAGIAYSRNQSIAQAIGAGLASTPYLLYVGFQAITKK